MAITPTSNTDSPRSNPLSITPSLMLDVGLDRPAARGDPTETPDRPLDLAGEVLDVPILIELDRLEANPALDREHARVHLEVFGTDES